MNALDLRPVSLSKPLLIGCALAFMYSMVLAKLGYDWWTDDNYSHGLLVPFVIGYIVWSDFDDLKELIGKPNVVIGLLLALTAFILLLGGTMAAVLFAQRISLVVMIAGILVFFFGKSVVRKLAVPFVLILLAIPVPQILFNKVAFPLQLLASKIADGGISLFGIPVARRGNVLEIVPIGSANSVSLEVVEACSGIRSLVTLITLALILAYFTSEKRRGFESGLRSLVSSRDFQRAAILMLAAVPVAILTNAARVTATGLIAYYAGQEGVEGLWHDISGSVVFLTALTILVVLNMLIKRLLSRDPDYITEPVRFSAVKSFAKVPLPRTIALFVAILVCGVFVNWFQYRGEVHAARRPLSEMPRQLGTWEQRNEDIRFDPETEKVLRASDYVMRDYYGPGKRLNLYVGYYESQRSGATYHSPLSCLPGTGWEMSEPQTLQITTPGGRNLEVNRYIVQQGERREYLLYWYQGRGRTSASEYVDKLFTSLDSVTKRRSDGGMIRIMTPLGKDPARSLAAAVDLTSHVADHLTEFLPD